MAVNYTPEMVDTMKQEYIANPTRETVEKLANELDKSIKSVIGKLSREGVYQKTEYLTKAGEKPVTKQEIVETIAGILAVEYQALAGLEKSPKSSLKLLEETLIITIKPEMYNENL